MAISACNSFLQATSENELSLECHAATPSALLKFIKVGISRADELRLDYHVVGDIDALTIPSVQPPQRRDELWRHTCAEIFIAESGVQKYVEYNFSPSSQWAAYEFTGYRQGMKALVCEPPVIGVSRTGNEWLVHAEFPLPEQFRSPALQVGLAMVIEDGQGHCSYWALRHGGDRPDFHLRETWSLHL